MQDPSEPVASQALTAAVTRQPSKALAMAMVEGHRASKMIWLVTGGSEEGWEARLRALEATAAAIPEPDYP